MSRVIVFALSRLTKAKQGDRIHSIESIVWILYYKGGGLYAKS